MGARQDVTEYIGEVIGETPELRALARSQVARVPIFLTAAYELASTELFGTRLVIAFKKAVAVDATPTEYREHVRLLQEALGLKVVLGLHVAPTYVRNRLVRKGVPFVVAGRQVFLPFLAVDLKERQPQSRGPAREKLTAPAQAVLLRHLLGKKIEGTPLGDVAGQLGYSAMTLSKVAAELQAHDLAVAPRNGKARLIEFRLPRRELWEKALPVLASPVRNTLFVQGRGAARKIGVVAGLTALARYTAISGGEVTVFAVWRNALREAVRRNAIVECQVPEDADAVIEAWTYDPLRMADIETVDRLSLYLSLRASEDERIQKELTALLEGVAW
ncbi:MAG: hypothetical protein FJ109_05055 [Deltaproteobacteria bacterium]|nr:hypothetical protein [Deltaproteobacteria bacterium]